MNAFYVLMMITVIIFIFGYFLFKKTFFIEKNLLLKLKTIWIIIMIIFFLMAWQTESGKKIWKNIKNNNCLRRQ